MTEAGLEFKIFCLVFWSLGIMCPSPDIVSERMTVHGLPALSLPGARTLNSGASGMILFPKDPLTLVFLPILPLSLSRKVIRRPGWTWFPGHSGKTLGVA